MSHEIVVTDEPGRAIQDVVLQGLVAFNVSRAGDGGHRPLAALVKDAAGAVVGGLWGATYWQWLFIQYFWVPEGLRGRGLGAEVLRRAELEARFRGCRGVWLDTFSFQAPAFYERHGYRVFGTLDDYPPGHHRIFLTKRLD
jgi:GNAT superfamily N-acetyltransferase